MVWFVLVWSGSVVGRLVGHGRSQREDVAVSFGTWLGWPEKWFALGRVSTIGTFSITHWNNYIFQDFAPAVRSA